MLRCGDTLEAGEQRGNPVLNARRVLASVGDLTRWAVLCWAYRVAGRRQRRLIERLPETLAACVPVVPRLRVLKKRGNASGADEEFAAARALSATYVETATVNTGD